MKFNLCWAYLVSFAFIALSVISLEEQPALCLIGGVVGGMYFGITITLHKFKKELDTCHRH